MYAIPLWSIVLCPLHRISACTPCSIWARSACFREPKILAPVAHGPDLSPRMGWAAGFQGNAGQKRLQIESIGTGMVVQYPYRKRARSVFTDKLMGRKTLEICKVLPPVCFMERFLFAWAVWPEQWLSAVLFFQGRTTARTCKFYWSLPVRMNSVCRPCAAWGNTEAVGARQQQGDWPYPDGWVALPG